MLLALLALQAQSPRFLPPTPLLFEGVPFTVPGGHAAPAVHDLDQDGLEDLIVGHFKFGQIVVFKNLGSPSKHVYRHGELLMAGDKPISVSYGCCIGATPQFIDLDRDGTTDLVTGSYTGGLWFYKGAGKGKFETGTPILDDAGLPLKPDAVLAPAFADWDEDGDLDMVLGTQQGAVLLFTNETTGFKLTARLTWDGKEIDVHDGGPALYDFNDDGAIDLLIGGAEGTLNIYMGKTKGGTDFLAGKSVLPAFPREVSPGIRLKPFVTDWNNDGKPDILVGDYRPDAGPVTPVPQDVQEEITRLVAQSSSFAFTIFSRSTELETQAKKEAGIDNLTNATPEQRQKYDAVLSRLTTDDKALNDAKDGKAAAERRLEQLRTQKPIEGTVWVFYGI
jgi:hypothetical protein